MPRSFLLFLFICFLASFSSTLKAGDDWKPPESLEELPSLSELPDLFQFADGTRVKTEADWMKRRAEIKSMLQYYEYGHLPPAPDSVRVEDFESRALPELSATEEKMTLVLGSEKKLRMRIAVYIPSGSGKFPVMVREEHALGHIEEVPLLMERQFIFVEYAREDLDPDKPNIEGPAQAAYPDYDWATLAVWAWGGMRVMDYLETREDVQLDQVGITGHSRGGKTALLAGALDDRFALVAPNGSGCGGAGCFRIEGKKCETLELITQPERFGYWFHPRFRWFADQEERLPFDQHFLKALVAPRALICTEARGDHWANPEGIVASSEAARPAFDFLNVPSKNALHFREGGHDFKPEDWKAILDFAEWQFRGKEPQNRERFWSAP